MLTLWLNNPPCIIPILSHDQSTKRSRNPRQRCRNPLDRPAPTPAHRRVPPRRRIAQPAALAHHSSTSRSRPTNNRRSVHRRHPPRPRRPFAVGPPLQRQQPPPLRQPPPQRMAPPRRNRSRAVSCPAIRRQRRQRLPPLLQLLRQQRKTRPIRAARRRHHPRSRTKRTTTKSRRSRKRTVHLPQRPAHATPSPPVRLVTAVQRTPVAADTSVRPVHQSTVEIGPPPPPVAATTRSRGTEQVGEFNTLNCIMDVIQRRVSRNTVRKSIRQCKHKICLLTLVFICCVYNNTDCNLHNHKISR